MTLAAAPGLHLRLALTAKLVSSNRLDGAWWPGSRDLTMEIPLLVKAIEARFGWLRTVLVSVEDWDAPPPAWRLTSRRAPRLVRADRHPRHVVSLLRDDGRAIGLLLIAPAEPEAVARTAMHLAASVDNSTSAAETLLRARCFPHAPGASPVA